VSPTTLNLTDEQTAIVAHNSGPSLVFAVAGAGKTTAMVHRIERLVRERVFPASKILATSFGRATVMDIRKELERWPHCTAVTVTTLHSVGHRVLQNAVRRGYCPANDNPRGETEKLPEAITRRAVARARAEDVPWRSELDQFDEEDFIGYVGACKGNLEYADLERANLPEPALLVASQAKAPPGLEWYLDLYRLYELVRSEMNLVTFDDMLLSGWELLISHDDLLSEARGQYQCILIDEFQDVNLVQSELLDLISSPQHNIMAIGDDDQTIYEWRGASPRFILEFERRYGAQKFLIHDNFRCRASHVALANRVIAVNRKRELKHLSLTRGFGGSTHVHLEPDATAQALTIITEIRAVLEAGRSANDVAILVRAYAQTPDLETALERAQIPYRLVGAAPFYRRLEIAALLSYLRLAMFEWQLSAGQGLSAGQVGTFNTSFGLACNRPSRYITRELMDQVRETVALRGVGSGGGIPCRCSKAGYGATHGRFCRSDRMAFWKT
jgi:DNA helicase II / ATP-dependent DNA helicase PcrA